MQESTASVEVRNKLYPEPRERNLTWPFVCPWLRSKLSGSLPYASVVRSLDCSSEVAACNVRFTSDRALDVLVAHKAAVSKQAVRMARLSHVSLLSDNHNRQTPSQVI